MIKRYYIIFTIVVSLFICKSAVCQERFIDNGNGTITDLQLGIMWSQTDNNGDISWKQAGQWVKYTFPYSVEPFYQDWRLPTLKELKTLYDSNSDEYETDCGQKVRITPEIRITCGWVWTSENKSITASVYNFDRGYHFTDRMVHSRGYRALAVRPIRSDN